MSTELPGEGATDRRAELARDAWKVWLVAGVVMAVGYLLLPSQDLQDLLYQVPEMLAAIVIAAGVAINRPVEWRPWLLLAVGLALTAAGDWTWVILLRVYELEPFPSVADVFYLAGVGFIAVALLWLVKGRVPGGDRAGVLDALIVAVGLGMVSWVFFMAPIVADPSQSFVDIAVALAYPVLDVLLLGVMVRLFLAPGRKDLSLKLLIGAVMFWLLADYPYALLVLADGYQTGQLVDVGWLLGAAFWAAAALHPSMREVAQPVEATETRFSFWRLALLAGASLMAPAVLVIQGISGEPINVPVIAAGCVVLFLLVIARLGGVVDDLRATLRQRRILEQELERRALHDPLTGLANRVLFAERLDHALMRRDESVAVLFLDLDDFKTVNDAYGHAAGDAVLCSVADALRRILRPGDTVARLGGDEFAVLLEDRPDVYSAGLVAGRLLEAVQMPTSVAGRQHSIGASIGIAMGVSGGSTAADLMRDADIAMYVAKGQGKGKFTVFEATTHEAVVRGLELREDLERGIHDQQFELHYQPILQLATGAVAGIEALARWRHPTRGLLQPEEFIPLAETTGAIVPLGRWVIESACRQAAAWNTHGPMASGAFMSVNLSPVQLAHPGFADTVAEALASSGLSPEQLMLEVRESRRLDGEAVTAALQQLREQGTRLAIDDFGTGHGSLSQLSRSQFDTLKIDPTFVAAVPSDDRAESLVAGVLDLARRLNLTVVAEGIEEEAQLLKLRELGCELGQGFHFAQPMPASELTALLGKPERAEPRRSSPKLGLATEQT